jgi:hypothetical protein
VRTNGHGNQGVLSQECSDASENDKSVHISPVIKLKEEEIR